jgi:hypothetical protein
MFLNTRLRFLRHRFVLTRKLKIVYPCCEKLQVFCLYEPQVHVLTFQHAVSPIRQSSPSVA